MRQEGVASLRAVFDAPDRGEAERQLEIAATGNQDQMKSHRYAYVEAHMQRK